MSAGEMRKGDGNFVEKMGGEVSPTGKRHAPFPADSILPPLIIRTAFRDGGKSVVITRNDAEVLATIKDMLAYTSDQQLWIERLKERLPHKSGWTIAKEIDRVCNEWDAAPLTAEELRHYLYKFAETVGKEAQNCAKSSTDVPERDPASAMDRTMPR